MLLLSAFDAPDRRCVAAAAVAWRQVLLANPVCVLAYALATWHFFYDRIPYEEELLAEFFGDTYRAYRKRTFVGIPLVEWAVSRFPP